MAVDMSCLDLELLLSFSTPVVVVDSSEPVEVTPLNEIPPTPVQIEAETAASISLISNSSLNESLQEDDDDENSQVVNVVLTDKNGQDYATSYIAKIKFTRDDFNKKKNNYKVKGSVTIYKCQMCPYKNQKIQSIKEHLINHVEYKNSIQCRYCRYFAPYGLSLNQHEVLHREYTPSGVSVEKEKKKTCPICPYKAVKNREIKCHQLNHEFKEGYIKCRYCNYYLANTKGMKQHEILHSMDKSFHEIKQIQQEKEKELEILKTQQQIQQKILEHQQKAKLKSQQAVSKVESRVNKQFVSIIPETTNSSVQKEPPVAGNSQLSTQEISIIKSTLKDPEICSKQETITMIDKKGIEFSISYLVSKLSSATNKYREKGSSTMYCCQSCPYTTRFSTHLREHLPHHRAYPKSVKCRYCEYYASNTLNLKQHEILHPQYQVAKVKKPTKKDLEQPTVFKNEKALRKHKCQICPFEAQHPYLIERHMKNHVFQEGYAKCKECDYYLVTSNNMKQHELLHQVQELQETQIKLEEKKKKHRCKLCPFRSVQKTHLERHVKFHDKSNINTKKGYYTCEYCQYYSTNTGKLKQHEALHTQEWEELIEKVAADDFEEVDIDEDE